MGADASTVLCYGNGIEFSLMTTGNTILDDLGYQVQDEGLKPDTKAYDRRLRQVKVEKCREMKGQHTCSECPTFEFCDLAKHVLRDHRGIG